MAISSGRAQNNRVPQLAQLGLVRNLHPPETKIEDKTLRVVSLPGLALSSGHTYTWSTFAHQDILEMEGECECESAAPRVRGGPHTLTLILMPLVSVSALSLLYRSERAPSIFSFFPLHVFSFLSCSVRLFASLVLLEFSLLGYSVRLNGPSPLRDIYMH